MDTIVFNNYELDEAAASGAVSIALCDNTFVIPRYPGVNYCAIGNVQASIDMTSMDAAKNMITFSGFLPEFSDMPAYANVEHGIRPQTSYCSSFASSFASSYSTSFAASFMTSFSTLFAMSFSTSFATSFVSSFGTSFASSFVASFVASFDTSFVNGHVRENYIIKEISVNGYGLNLI